MPTRPAHKIRFLMTGQSRDQKKPAPFFVLEWLFPGLLVVLAGVLAYLNHVPGTWLTGWDTLHPEFNFWLNLQRVVFGLFRTDQGLGTIAVHAHYVELPRILILWLWSFVVPTTLLRYLYVAACLILGPLGVYFWLKKVLLNQYPAVIAATGGFGAGMWYLFNLGTLQHFIVPFEMFPTNYAAMGWTFWLILKYIEKPRRSWLVGWFMFQFWASNMAYSFVSWYVYFVAMTGFILLYAGLRHWRLQQPSWKPSIALILVAFLANVYWLFPNWYFVANNSWHVPLAKNNQLISEEIFFHNKEFGTPIDTITMKNHLFSWQIREGDEFVPLFDDVSTYLDQGFIALPVGFFVLIVLGYLVAVKKAFERTPTETTLFGLAFFPIMIGGMLVFLSLNPPLETLIAPLRESVSVLREGLRNPFIKVNIVLMASYAAGFGLGLGWLTAALARGLKSQLAASMLMAGAVLLPMLMLGKPFFEGHLIDRRVQNEIPTEYFAMFEWFKTQPTTKRVLVLPAPSFWAWDYHSWGYQGAGFMWFGIPQPFLSRDSDRWNPYNEQAFREISQAIAENNWKLFYGLLEKYHIGWVVFDKTVTTNGEPNSILNQSRIDQFLSSQDLFTEQVFSDQLSVFTNRQLAELNNPVLTKDELANVTPAFFWHYHDSAFKDLGSYITTSDLNSTYYPARELLTPFDRLDTTRIWFDETTLKLQPTLQTTESFTYDLGSTDSLPAEVSFRVTEDNESWLLIRPLLPYTQADPDPYITVVPLENPPAGSFYLSMNSDVFFVDATETAVDQFLGTTQFDLDQDYSLTLFDPSSGLPAKTEFDTSTTTTYDCSLDATEFTPVPSKLTGDQLTVSARDSTICSQVVVPAAPERSSDEWLIQSRFSFSSSDNSEAEFCLLNTETNRCLNKQTIFAHTAPTPDQVVEVTASVPTENVSQLQWLFVTEPQTLFQETTMNSITYSQPELEFLPAATKQSFQLRLPEGLSQPTLSISPDEKIMLPFFGPAETSNLVELNHQLDTCGSQDRAELNRQNVDGAVEFSAKYGQTCDRVLFDQASQTVGQLVSITSRNLSGLPARVCVRNLQSNRCDLYVPLTDSDEFISETFVLPPMARAGSGYAVSFVTFAPGREPSINQIKSVTLQPFAYDILTSLRTPNEVETQSALIYPHSFQPGFVAGWHHGLSWQPLTDHVLVNNWANGWLITSQEISQQTAQGSTLRVFFLPQLLEFFGLGLTGLSLSYLVLQPLFKRLRLNRK